MTNELFERELRNTLINDVSLADYVKEHYASKESGKWIEDAKTYYEELNKRGLGVDEYTPYFTDDIACSVCLAKYNTIDNETELFKYCPNCGACMKDGRTLDEFIEDSKESEE